MFVKTTLSLQSKAEYFEAVAATLDRSSMVFVLRQIDKHFVEKNSAALHISVNSFKQMLMLVQLMMECDNEDFQDVARTLLGHLFYEKGHIDMLKLISKQPLNMSRL